MYIDQEASSNSSSFGGAELRLTDIRPGHSAPPNDAVFLIALFGYKHFTPIGVHVSV